MSILYDSDNPDSIPNGVAAAGYVNGYAGPAWLARGFPRFPSARRITVFPTDEGDTCDVEWLDLTPEQAPPWVKGRRAAGVLRPWVYCNRSNRPAVEAALAAAGVTATQVALWVATLDGTQTVPAGPYPVAAVQYANATNSGGHYDLSLVTQTFGPGGGTIGGESDMIAIIRNPTTQAIAIWADAGKRHIEAVEWDLLHAQPPAGLGLAYRDINQQQWDAIPDVSQASGGTVPTVTPEPAEPKTVTGTFTGTLA
jgi:hypothetical protein